MLRVYPVLLFLLLWICRDAFAQDNASHVDPFIGTDRSDAPTIWGQYGGTYPGAVAPWGMVQLSPETRNTGGNGYFFSDKSICYFTCIGHSSGYPNGSRGNVQVMFGNTPRLKKTEEAHPGYYSVVFADDSNVEMTVTTRTGMFRYRPADNRTVVTIADAGEIRLANDRTVEAERNNGLFIFNRPWTNSAMEDHTLTLVFDNVSEKELLIKVAFSMVDMDGSRKNMDEESPGWDFDYIRNETYNFWNNELSVVQVQSGNKVDLTKFYTALYHSFLIPNIVSDVDGRYPGADRQIHTKEGGHEYGRFSTWDTFRSLHPLLCLLKPQRQRDMILSMLHLYDQRGYLPYTPMTGYHPIPVITDSYVKGITDFDADKAYRAMKKFLAGNEMPRPDTRKYISDGFLNDSIDESVSVTLDYAYNDWVLSVFAEITGHDDDAAMFRQRSFNYRNLFDVETQFMLPRNVSGFVRNPGEMGYKEANKWTASWFVPHNVQDLINLSGGNAYFVNHLHEAMQKYVIFDNEPVLHYPYLFSYAGRPDLTCYWVDHIRETCYTPTAGGIPGNDDLGSMSSWFVFSAMGFFPVCPGRPEYVLTTPLFTDMVIWCETGNEMKISADPDAIHSCFSEISLNGQEHLNALITHQQIIDGGDLIFKVLPSIAINGGESVQWDKFKRPTSLSTGKPLFQLTDAHISMSSPVRLHPHQQTWLHFTVTNAGETGTFPATVTDGQQVIAAKKVFVQAGTSVTDSVAFSVYREGDHQLSMEHIQLPLQVVSLQGEQTLVCNQLTANVILKKGQTITIETELQNISGKPIEQTVSLFAGDKSVNEWNCKLSPGEIIRFSKDILIEQTGFHNLKVLNKNLKIKVYDQPAESCVLDLDFNQPDEHIVTDASGFENHGTIIGNVLWPTYSDGHALHINTGSLVEFPMSESLDITGPTITLTAWVYPVNEGRGYIDFFTKGDYTVFQVDGGQLSFFAGGWGRGACKIPLPDNWLNNWHHIAGVCTGNELKLYFNGKLQQTIPVEGEIKSTEVPWNLGRNAEMPYSRRFEGIFDDVKIFKDALTDENIYNLIK